jgi:hypothetical protein
MQTPRDVPHSKKLEPVVSKINVQNKQERFYIETLNCYTLIWNLAVIIKKVDNIKQDCTLISLDFKDKALICWFVSSIAEVEDRPSCL